MLQCFFHDHLKTFHNWFATNSFWYLVNSECCPPYALIRLVCTPHTHHDTCLRRQVPCWKEFLPSHHVSSILVSRLLCMRFYLLNWTISPFLSLFGLVWCFCFCFGVFLGGGTGFVWFGNCIKQSHPLIFHISVCCFLTWYVDLLCHTNKYFIGQQPELPIVVPEVAVVLFSATLLLVSPR